MQLQSLLSQTRTALSNRGGRGDPGPDREIRRYQHCDPSRRAFSSSGTRRH